MAASWTLALLLLTGAGQTRPPSLPDDPTAEAEADAEEIDVESEPERELTTDERIALLEDELVDVKQRLEQAEVRESSRVRINFTGFVDFGFFYPTGDGVGWVQDFGHQAVPRLAGEYGWVFLGDIFATAVNSRGEPADLGEAPGADRFDSVDSGGAPSFLVNELNFRLGVALDPTLRLDASVNFVPRTGDEFALGDFFDVDIARAEWTPFEEQNISLYAGKIESTFGIEYKNRRADARFGVTPSLIARYTTGTQLGIKARARLFSDYLIVAGAVTNGAFTTEPFHFYREVDSNAGKTGTGRIATRIPMQVLMDALDGTTLEIGFSGAYGPQDRATDNAGETWFVGVDLEWRATSYAVKAQWMRGGSPGRPLDGVWALDLNDSGYVEFDWLFFPWLGVVLRAGLRDAFVWLGDERAYLTKSARFTAGLRAVLGHRIVVKAEYLRNEELGEVPSFNNDVFTTSLVLGY